jgi:hypothetical protein
MPLASTPLFHFYAVFRELDSPISGETLRDPTLLRLTVSVDSIRPRLEPGVHFVQRMRFRFSDGQETRAVTGAGMRFSMSARSGL